MFSVRACEQARKWKSTSGSQASARDPVLWPSPSLDCSVWCAAAARSPWSRRRAGFPIACAQRAFPRSAGGTAAGATNGARG